VSIALWKLNSEEVARQTYLYNARNIFQTESMRWPCISLQKRIYVLDYGMEESTEKAQSNSRDLILKTIAKYDLKSTFEFLFDNQNLNSSIDFV
jgi:hypothetical protein